ncbi:PaaX family transcriptional regulator C-terminal domain-containing protein [Microbacterium sp. ET2]|uniref:PaaX family transcriptional regulator n=1 Tax=Microbacterium albipurpureum TaxID=3050384 RepID=UPI00259C8607|nr:PaaX family transcriptional regulator C-terminal domain-containing protein [Microbacterium sp. ET2 (Ac-2212)]WJL94691.1 PaaX family transcriptional regulator C-terminal domain-containing protein [Microbacterium sp. ET2 (Ac-2212)]
MVDRLLPRDQQGARSQQLLTVLLGDYWHLRTEPLPSAALVALLHLFGVSAAAARAAVQRLARRGFLVPRKVGRATLYAVSPMSQASVDAHVQILFRSHLSPAWDGTWTLVSYSLPEEQRGLRATLREQLRQARFGSIHDGLWVRPGDALPRVAEIRSAIQPLGEGRIVAFSGARIAADDLNEFARTAFALDDVATDYERFIERWAGDAARVDRAGADAEPPVEPGEALLLRTSIMRDWRGLRHTDPMLPAELLSDRVPFARALEVCSTVYDGTGAAAEEAFRAVLRIHAPELEAHVSHHTFAGYRHSAPEHPTGH